MPDDVFKNRDLMKRQLEIPGIVSYSFIGSSTPEYHARVEEIVTRIVGPDNIRRRSFRESSAGTYTAYKYDIFHMEFDDVEQIYREVCALPGTRFVV